MNNLAVEQGKIQENLNSNDPESYASSRSLFPKSIEGHSGKQKIED